MKKWKEHHGKILLTSLVVMIPALVGILLWNKLPAEIATHFDFQGNPDGWSSKWFAVFGIPIFILVCHLISTIAVCSDPKNSRISGKILNLIFWICPIVSLFCLVAIYGEALNLGINTAVIGQVMVGMVFVIVGNYLPKCRQNYTVGIKLPWTLADEDNWNNTHRIAGWLWMIGGVVVIVSVFVMPKNTGILPVVMGSMIIVPMVYSFLYYLKTGQ